MRPSAIRTIFITVVSDMQRPVSLRGLPQEWRKGGGDCRVERRDQVVLVPPARLWSMAAVPEGDLSSTVKSPTNVWVISTSTRMRRTVPGEAIGIVLLIPLESLSGIGIAGTVSPRTVCQVVRPAYAVRRRRTTLVPAGDPYGDDEVSDEGVLDGNPLLNRPALAVMLMVLEMPVARLSGIAVLGVAFALTLGTVPVAGGTKSATIPDRLARLDRAFGRMPNFANDSHTPVSAAACSLDDNCSSCGELIVQLGEDRVTRIEEARVGSGEFQCLPQAEVRVRGTHLPVHFHQRRAPNLADVMFVPGGEAAGSKFAE